MTDSGYYDRSDFRSRHEYLVNTHQRRKTTLYIALTGIFIAVIGILAAALIAVLIIPKNSASGLSVVQQPPSAANVAIQFGCTGFIDKGSSQAGGVVDSGVCIKNGVTYAIDTFQSTDIRDNWLKAAEPLGVNPLQTSATAVVYKSISS